MLNSQEVIGIVIGIFAVVYFIFNYRRFSGIKSDTRLYLKKTRDIMKNETGVIDSATMIEADASSSTGARVKSLNVLFMYNGHSFDAHEILGIPPGSNMKTVDEAYKKLLASIRPESREFVDTAYQVLKLDIRKNH